MTRPLLIVRDDAQTRRLAPFAAMRPLGAMPVGVFPLAARWASRFPDHEVRLLGVAGVPFSTDAGAPPPAPALLPAGSIIAESRAAVAFETTPAPAASSWSIDGIVAAVRTDRACEAATIGDTALTALTAAPAAPTPLRGRWITHAWDLLTITEALLAEDLALHCAGHPTTRHEGLTILGAQPVRIDASARIEPQVVIDATQGPVWIDADVRVSAFTRLAGPLYLGPGTQVFGGRVGASVIGPHCRVAGEVAGSILAGFVNKAHDGFVGHSVLAPWVNVGAGTITSNLKNSYGSVRVWSPEGVIDTGRQFMGALIGDHVKLGIGTMLGTGSVIGAGASVFGTQRPPTHVPPFAWGDAPPFQTVGRAQFLTAAARVMARRDHEPTPERLAALGRCYDWIVSGLP